MLELNDIRSRKDQVIAGLKKRGLSTEDLIIIEQVVQLDDKRKSVQTELDRLLADRNRISKEIGALFQAGKQNEANEAKQQVSQLKEKADVLQQEMQQTQDSIEVHLLNIPNVPHESVPAGQAEEDNEVYQDWTGPFPELPEDARPHWELAEAYNIIDFKLGAFITGSGFPLYRGDGARLQRALINFFLDEAREAGYEEIIPPYMVNAASARATGQLPDKEGQMYHMERDELYMIPTAEVPLTNMYRDQILKESDFPIKLTGYTPCFRREAGSYGSDVKGLNRVHQFDKVEIVHLVHPDTSYEVLGNMLKHVAGLLDKLELPYRILRLCGGDLGFTSALTFDFEVFSAAQKKWLEVSSVSNFETFQANRMKLRFKDEFGKTRLAHTLNGSALALARIVAALLENNQTAEGIRIPKALQSYTGFQIIPA
jgi:seryl-tRNA synthetase